MSFYKELLYNSNHAISPVVKVQFSIMSPETIRLRSVVEVASAPTGVLSGQALSTTTGASGSTSTAPSSNMTYRYDEPVQNGLFDPRMGVVELGKTCPTCGQRHTFCPGHFGHIELARPVFAVQFFEIVRRCLRCVCIHCSSILLPPAMTTSSTGGRKAHLKSNQKRFEATHRICQKVKRCPVCAMRQPDKVQREGVLRIALEWSATASDAAHRHILLAEDVIRIFRRISNHDAMLMGIGYRPEWLILTVLVVPAPTVRPTVRNDTGQRQEDDLTHKLITIIKANANLRSLIHKHQQTGGGVVEEPINTEESAATDAWAAAGYGPISTKLPPQQDTVLSWLQYEVATLIDNNFPGLAPSQQVRSGRIMRSITDRLRGKEGRIRGNLLGKRVDFSARSVITPDPHIGVDELGVPIAIATNLTFAEVVNRFSINRLRQFVRNGPNVYPGARFVRKITQQGQTLRLASVPNLEEVADGLEVGDIVDRHIINGDCVMFNRQPSLHRMSMMSHRVRVMPNETFRLNVCVTPCYNADFDGDEMNMHVPQSLQTHEEIRQLASVENQIISPKDSKPIISIVQDVVLGVFLMTLSSGNGDEFKLSRQDAFNLLGSLTTTYDTDGTHAIRQALSGKNKWSGRELLSRVLPRFLQITNGGLQIVDGEIKSGQVTKQTFQAQSKGILHLVNNDLGGRRAIRLLNDTQRLVCDWLIRHGFSVGASDAILPPDTLKKIYEAHAGMDERIDDLVMSLHDGRFRNPSTKSNAEAFENALSSIVAEGSSIIDKVSLASINSATNRLMTMVESGSKGSNINIIQIAACVGQQMVDNQRVAYSLEHRTLPHFCKFDDTPSARGYVRSSFAHGLNPQEFFFHAIGGREGLIDTAVKTSSSGYTQRKLAKAMEDLKLWHDGTVRKANGAIVQFLYGEDGMDATSIEKQRLSTLGLSNSEIRSTFGSGMTTTAIPKELASLMTRSAQASWKKDAPKLLPAHVEDLIRDKEHVILSVFHGQQQDECVSFPANVQHLLQLHINNTKTTSLSDIHVSDALDLIEKYTNQVPKMLGILIRCHTSPRKLVEMRCTMAGLQSALDAIHSRLIGAYAHAGELVGIIAAQSISEPTTQLTLNSVEWNTELLLDFNGTPRRLYIGKLIDEIIQNASNENTEYHPNDTTLTWIKEKNIKVLSCDEDGKIMWKEVEAVTRHPPINEDGSGTLLRVTTRSGRQVVATKAKSFLRRINNKIVPARGDELNVGDYLPVSSILPIENMEACTNTGTCTYVNKTDDIIPFVETTQFGTLHVTRTELVKYVQECTNETDMTILLQTIEEDVDYDPIVEITEMTSNYPHVYDLTVKDTRNFNIYNGLCIRDTFHLSGYNDASRAVRGLPRLQEIIDVTTSKNMRTPIMRITGTSASNARKLQAVYLKHVVTRSRIIFDRKRYDCTRASLESRLKRAGETVPMQADDSEYMPWMVAIDFSRTELLHHGITMLDIDRAVTDQFGSAVMCMVSNDSVDGNPFLHVRTQTPPGSSDALVEMRALEDILLESVKIRGVSGIRDVLIRPDITFKYRADMDGTFGKIEGALVAETDGSSLAETLGQPWIDARDVYSNDIVDIYTIFGIEAAREVIYREIMQVMEEGRISINYRHISILIDTMTSRGTLMSINRHGINQSDNGPLAKSSFEETNDRLIKAGAFAEVDHMQGVSANIMFGQVASYGTADSRVVVDIERLPKIERMDAYASAFAFPT